MGAGAIETFAVAPLLRGVPPCSRGWLSLAFWSSRSHSIFSFPSSAVCKQTSLFLLPPNHVIP